MRKLFKGARYGLGFYILYTIVFGALIFNLSVMQKSSIDYDTQAMLQSSGVATNAYLLDGFETSLNTRLSLIENASSSINISYYSIHGGEARDLFFGALLDKADEGVKINIILDDVFYYQTRDEKVHYEALMVHENITFKFYERFNPLLPYTMQNRLHDKLIMVDDAYGIIGGRNIGDRYYNTGEGGLTHDRDVLIFSDGSAHPTVEAMNAYYETLFTHEYTHEKSVRQREALSENAQRMKDAYSEYKHSYDIESYLFDHVHPQAIAVDNATFVHGPLTRMHKDPVVFSTLSDIAQTRDEWLIQSPYITFSDKMLKSLPDYEDQSITFLTNSPARSPNIFAMSGYMRYRDELAVRGNVYEYHGEHSLHAKTMLFGDDISVIGSLNLDPRSATLSTESVMIITGERFNAHVGSVIDEYLSSSLRVSDDGAYVPGNVDPVEYPPFKRTAIRLTGLFTRFIEPML